MNQLIKTDQHVDYGLIDCSSSMTSKWRESIAALDAYIAGVKAEHIQSRTILHMFYSQNVDYVYRDCGINDWVDLQRECPEPYGGTPLYDAVNAMGRRLRDLDPPRASIVIVTDGDDNESKTSVDQAKAILDWCRAKGWQITFIGADFSTAHQAKMLGSNANESIGVQKRLLSDAARSLAKKRGNYGRTGAPMHWTSEEQKQFGGYLAGPQGK